MSIEVKLNLEWINQSIETALIGTVLFVQNEVVKVTPRDLQRLPQNINRKDGQAPHRSTYFKPVNIGGNWYLWVSGKLKQSIANKKESRYVYRVGVTRGPATAYAKYLEFWTRKMKPRSFLRKTATESKNKALEVFSKLFKELLW